MAASTYYTAEMVRALPDDGNRYETVYGELLVTPSPREPHQRVLGRLYENLAGYLRAQPAGAVYFSPADISWGPDIMVQPDLFVVPIEEARTEDWARMQTLLLAVEVLSQSSTRADRFTKRRLYQSVGVAVYWAVDIEGRQVEVWTPDATLPTVERERLVWSPAGSRQALTIVLEELFRPIR